MELGYDGKKKRLLRKLLSAQDDMDAHSYNSYRDDDEYPILFTVKEIQWLKDELV